MALLYEYNLSSKRVCDLTLFKLRFWYLEKNIRKCSKSSIGSSIITHSICLYRVRKLLTHKQRLCSYVYTVCVELWTNFDFFFHCLLFVACIANTLSCMCVREFFHLEAFIVISIYIATKKDQRFHTFAHIHICSHTHIAHITTYYTQTNHFQSGVKLLTCLN